MRHFLQYGRLVERAHLLAALLGAPISMHTPSNLHNRSDWRSPLRVCEARFCCWIFIIRMPSTATTRRRSRLEHCSVRLQLHALAYNLGNFRRTLALPDAVEQWSLTSLREKLIKIGDAVMGLGAHRHRWSF